MSVTSYSKPTENGDPATSKTFMTRLISTQDLTPDSPPCCLHPYEGNIHEIKATRYGTVEVLTAECEYVREGGERGKERERERERESMYDVHNMPAPMISTVIIIIIC